MRILTVDRGNSSAKTVIWENGVPLSRLRLSRVSFEELNRHFDFNSIDGVSFCSVAGDSRKTEDILRKVAGDKLLIVNADTPLPFSLYYSNKATLGSDRIAAIAGAIALRPGKGSLVVDMGTAMTIDVCDAFGNFRGGNISPGMYLRFLSLHNFTGALPLVTPDGEVPYFGSDTFTAIRGGVIGGMAAEIIYSAHKAEEKFGCDGVVFTGADADKVIPLAELDNMEIINDPDLVGRGLYEIYIFNRPLNSDMVDLPEERERGKVSFVADE